MTLWISKTLIVARNPTTGTNNIVVQDLLPSRSTTPVGVCGHDGTLGRLLATTISVLDTEERQYSPQLYCNYRKTSGRTLPNVVLV